jgi:subtilisin family serine protease
MKYIVELEEPSKMRAAVAGFMKDPLIRKAKKVSSNLAVIETDKPIDEIKSLVGVKEVHKDFKVKKTLVDSVIEIGRYNDERLLPLSGKGVKVAVVDTGVDNNHKALPNVVRILDATGLDFKDIDPHGTHVAGIIASNDLAFTGVAKDAQICDFRALDPEGEGWASDIIECMEAALENGCQICNMSLGSDYPNNGNDILSRTANDLMKKGMVMVVAAGNSGSLVGAPGAARDVITVGATDGDKIADFSSFGVNNEYQKPEVCAPGVNIYSTIPNNNFKGYSGTSMATPHITGVIALLLEFINDLSTYQVKAVIQDACIPLDDLNEKQGFGKIYVPGILPTLSEICPWCHCISHDLHTGICLESCNSCDKNIVSAIKCLIKAIF